MYTYIPQTADPPFYITPCLTHLGYYWALRFASPSLPYPAVSTAGMNSLSQDSHVGCRGPSPSFLTFRFPAFPEISMVWGQRRGSYKATHSDRVLVVSLVFIFTGGTRGSGDTSLHGAVLGWEQPLTCSYFSHIFHFHAVCLCLCGTRRCYNHLYLSGLSQLCLALE